MTIGVIHQYTDSVDTIHLNDPTAVLAVQEYPASGAFVDLGAPNFPSFTAFRVRVLVADTNDVVLQVKQAQTISGSTINVDLATTTILSTAAVGTVAVIELETRKLDINNDYKFVTLDVTGTAGDGEYVIDLLAFDAHEERVTQTETTQIVYVVAGQP